MKEHIPNNAEAVKEKYQHLTPYKNVEIPKQHRIGDNIHSLRCFKKIWQRDSENKVVKSLSKKRCGNHVVEGFLYCKFHGGKPNLPTKLNEDGEVERSAIVEAYRDVYSADVGDLLEAFLNDSRLLDLKPDLANLRIVLNKYIEKLLKTPSAGSVQHFMAKLRNIMIEEEKTEEWKFDQIIELSESMQTITNGKAIDRINRCVENLGRIVEKIHKFETKDNFILTPDGLKILLRAITDLLANVKNDEERNNIKDGLLQISIETKGEVANYKNEKIKIVDAEIVD